MRDSLMTRPRDSDSSSGRILGGFEDITASMSTIPVVASERVVLGSNSAADQTSPPQATDASRIDYTDTSIRVEDEYWSAMCGVRIQWR